MGGGVGSIPTTQQMKMNPVDLAASSGTAKHLIRVICKQNLTERR